MWHTQWIDLFARNVLQLFRMLLCIFALNLLPRWRLLQALQLGGWLGWLAYACTHTVQHTTMSSQECTLGCLVGLTLFLTQIMAHMAILLEAFLQQSNIMQLRQQQFQLHATCFSQQLQPASSVAVIIVSLLTPIMLLHCLIIWSLQHYSSEASRFYWISLPSILALQLKLISFLAEIVDANTQLCGIRQQLKLLAVQHFGQAELQLGTLERLKLRYSDMYHLFELMNMAYGTSLLATSIVFFVDFVCNSYWIFMGLLLSSFSVYGFLQNFVFVFNVVLLLSSACWYCQQSFNKSRQIGCLISKLVKPMGNKRYNDLVSEFSLQALHQRFVVTAKDFFTLNLHLLSSMFAAVVTYLVILLQFMFAEKSAEKQVKTK